MTSKYREDLLFGSMNYSDIGLPPQKPFGGEKARQIFLDGFKIEYSPSKYKKSQNILSFPEL